MSEKVLKFGKKMVEIPINREKNYVGYYQQELNKLKPNEGIITVQFHDSVGNSTKCMDLNPESLEAIDAFLVGFAGDDEQ